MTPATASFACSIRRSLVTALWRGAAPSPSEPMARWWHSMARACGVHSTRLGDRASRYTWRVRVLSPEEEAYSLAHCGPQLKPLVHTTLHTGFRMLELLSIIWDDVDFRRGIITVWAASAKNGESRSVPMNDVVTGVLGALRLHSLPDSPVFCSSRGTPYRSFRGAFEHAVRKAGIADFTFHDLRYTFASRLVMAGVDLPTVQALMGHKGIAMTLRYTHLSNDHKQRAVRVLEQFGEKSHQFSQHQPLHGLKPGHK
jgi:integrase